MSKKKSKEREVAKKIALRFPGVLVRDLGGQNQNVPDIAVYLNGKSINANLVGSRVVLMKKGGAQ